MINSRYKIGQKIRIIDMDGEPRYKGKIGVITRIDDMGQVFGTWGGLALVPGWDKFEIIDNQKEKTDD